MHRLNNVDHDGNDVHRRAVGVNGWYGYCRINLCRTKVSHKRPLGPLGVEGVAEITCTSVVFKKN